MANELDIAVTQFTSNLQMRVQQLTSKIRGRVAEGPHKGKQAAPVQYIAPFKVQTPAARFAPLQLQGGSYTRRWVFPKDGDLPVAIDSFEELRLISDPKSQYASSSAAAVGREWDDRLIAAAFADAKTGQDVDSFATETFDSTTYGISDTYGAGSTSVGLTVAKLQELKRKFRHYGEDGNLDNEQLTILIGSQQEQDLLGQTQVVNTDYNDRPVLVDGKVRRFMGFDFEVIERLSVASNVRSCIAFMKSGLYLGVWQDMTSNATQRTDLSGQPWQLYTKLTSGATRLEPGKLMVVKCADTTGASITP